jgi:hypothetical protein
MHRTAGKTAQFAKSGRSPSVQRTVTPTTSASAEIEPNLKAFLDEVLPPMLVRDTVRMMHVGNAQGRSDE